MLNQKDLDAISAIIDQKLEEKLEQKLNQKFDQKLKPIFRELRKIRRDLSITISHFDNRLYDHENRLVKVETTLHLT